MVMSEELSESQLKRLSLSMVSSGVVAGAGIGYFTTYIPYESPLNIVVGGIIGGILLGGLPALLFWKWQLRNVRG